MRVKFASVLPHPPIVIPEIGGGELSRIETTVRAMENISTQIGRELPQTLVFVSPHSPILSDCFAVKTQPVLKGSLSRFGAGYIAFSLDNDIELVETILEQADKLDISTYQFGEELVQAGYSDELDHGVLVPLYYLESGKKCKIVSLSISELGNYQHYVMGLAIQKAANNLGRDIAFIASGDLSHRLTRDAPAGYNRKGQIFDQEIKTIFQRGSFQDLFAMDRNLVAGAGECGFRSIIMLAGTLNGYSVQTDVLSYEGPFGVGYMVASAKPLKSERERDIVDKIGIDAGIPDEESDAGVSAPVRVAQEAVETYIREGRIITPSNDLPPFLLEEEGASFVCLKKGAALRGCIGTTAPTQPSLAEEIIKNAIAAATKDPRFPAVRPQELVDIAYTVDILGEPEEIPDQSGLDPSEYGVIVESGFRKGLLLPDIEGVDTVEDQVAIAKQKAGIAPSEAATLYRFKVTRYK